MFNKKVVAVEPSRSVTMLGKAKEMMKVDSSVINMTAGEPDFDAPQAVRETIEKYLAEGYTHYTDSKGEPELRAAIAEKLARENGAPYSADNILVTPGAKFAVYASIMALINPGDEAIWLTPGWVSYPSMVTLCGGTPVAVHLDYDDDYRITTELLEAATTEKTKLLIINYPNNPTGKVLSQSDFDVLVKYMNDHPDVYLISDEIYEKIIYDGRKAISVASVDELRDRVIVINGFSKCSAMTGFRVGYLACGPEVFKMVMKIFQHTMSCTCGFIQQAAVVALTCTEETEVMRAAFERRRDMLVEGFNAIPGLELAVPEGAFYAWVKFDTEKSSGQIAMEILEQEKIAGVSGDAYGEEDKCCVRYFFANEKDIEEALKRFRHFVDNGGLK